MLDRTRPIASRSFRTRNTIVRWTQRNVLLCCGLVIYSLLYSPYALSHSGGTDERGCHAGTQPYHCHNEKDDSSSSSSGGVWAGLLVVGALVLWYQAAQNEDAPKTLSDPTTKKQSKVYFSPIIKDQGYERLVGIGVKLEF